MNAIKVNLWVCLLILNLSSCQTGTSNKSRKIAIEEPVKEIPISTREVPQKLEVNLHSTWQKIASNEWMKINYSGEHYFLSICSGIRINDASVGAIQLNSIDSTLQIRYEHDAEELDIHSVTSAEDHMLSLSLSSKYEQSIKTYNLTIHPNGVLELFTGSQAYFFVQTTNFLQFRIQSYSCHDIEGFEELGESCFPGDSLGGRALDFYMNYPDLPDEIKLVFLDFKDPDHPFNPEELISSSLESNEELRPLFIVMLTHTISKADSYGMNEEILATRALEFIQNYPKDFFRVLVLQEDVPFEIIDTWTATFRKFLSLEKRKGWVDTLRTNMEPRLLEHDRAYHINEFLSNVIEEGYG